MHRDNAESVSYGKIWSKRLESAFQRRMQQILQIRAMPLLPLNNDGPSQIRALPLLPLNRYGTCRHSLRAGPCLPLLFSLLWLLFIILVATASRVANVGQPLNFYHACRQSPQSQIRAMPLLSPVAPGRSRRCQSPVGTTVATPQSSQLRALPSPLASANTGHAFVAAHAFVTAQ